MFVKLISPLLEVEKKPRLDTVDGRSPKNQLKLVLCPIIYTILYIPDGCLGFLPPTVDHDLSLNFVELTIDLLHHNISRGRGRWWRWLPLLGCLKRFKIQDTSPENEHGTPKGEGPFQRGVFLGSKFQG